MYIKDSGPPPMAAVQLPAGAPSEPGGDGSPGIAGPDAKKGRLSVQADYPKQALANGIMLTGEQRLALMWKQ